MGLDALVTISARELMRIMRWYEIASEKSEILPEDVDIYNKISVIRKQVSEEEENEIISENA